jgi:membrane-bound inhibitor of C-type lysozyme
MLFERAIANILFISVGSPKRRPSDCPETRPGLAHLSKRSRLPAAVLGVLAFSVSSMPNAFGAGNAPQSNSHSQRILVAANTAGAGFSQNRVWATNGTYADISVSDCRDCGDDLGIIFACRGDGLPARVSVPWLATENGPAGLTLPLEMTIGHQRFVYDATLSNPGLVGHTPEFFINPHDPALEALMSGSFAHIVFDGVEANIGLRGSRSALRIFQAHCGWNKVPFGAQFSNGEPVGSGGFTQSGGFGQQGGQIGTEFPVTGTTGQDAGPNTGPDTRPDLTWFANSYPEGAGSGPTGTLTFGIPETDAIVFDAVCHPGKSPTAEVRLGLGLRTLKPGQPVTLYIEPNNANHQFTGTTFQVGGGEYEGMEAQIPLADPVWQAMAGAQGPFVIGAYGGDEATVQSAGASAAIGQFLQFCQVAAGQGVVPGEPQPPQAELPSQGVPQQPQTQQPQTQQPLAQPQQPLHPQAQPAAAIDGSYACSDGSNLLVAVTQLGANEIANVVRNGTEVHALVKQSAEGAGMRFSDGSSNLIAINGILMLTGAKGGASCQKN